MCVMISNVCKFLGLYLTQVSVGDTNIGHHLQWKYEPLFSGPQGLRRLAFIGQFYVVIVCTAF